MKELVCIICPRGCSLKVDDDLKVTGNFCPRGAKYAIEELTAPKRTLTTTIKTNDPLHPRVSVKSDKALPKDLIFKAMEIIEKKEVKLPIKIGDVLIENILDTGCNIIATRNME